VSAVRLLTTECACYQITGGLVNDSPLRPDEDRDLKELLIALAKERLGALEPAEAKHILLDQQREFVNELLLSELPNHVHVTETSSRLKSLIAAGDAVLELRCECPYTTRRPSVNRSTLRPAELATGSTRRKDEKFRMYWMHDRTEGWLVYLLNEYTGHSANEIAQLLEKREDEVLRLLGLAVTMLDRLTS
jgi:hypothetical protein